MVTKKLKSVLGSVVALAMVLSLVGGTVANAASALSASQISAIVGLLQSFGADAGTVANVTAALNGQATTGTTASTGSAMTSSFTFTPGLAVGSTGAAVTALQQILINAGDLTAVTAPTGYFGTATEAALIKYQVANGIVPSATTGGAGLFGPKTVAFLNANGGSMSMTSTGGTTTTSTVTPTGTSLNVSLAATSPAAGSVLLGQSAADLAEFTFTNTSATPAVVTNITLNRGGVSADTLLADVYLFQGATRLTDAATVSSGVVTFNSGTGIFTVAPGASVTVAVKSDIETLTAGGNAGQTVNLSLTGVTANVPVQATYPISGSTFTTASATDLATANLQLSTALALPTSVQAGTLQSTIWDATLNQGGRAVWLKSLAVKVIGSIPSDSLANIGLFVSGTQVATAAGVDANGMITFDLTANPYNINSSRDIQVRADIVNGASRSFSVELQDAADIQLVDSNYNVGITPSVTAVTDVNGVATVAGQATSFAAVTTNTISVTTGSVAVSLDSGLSSGNVVLGATGVDLAKYDMTAYGEDEKISYLNVASTQDLQNVTIYANGTSISSAQNVSSTSVSTFSLGSSLIIPAGQTVVVDVKGDLKTLEGNNLPTGASVIVTLEGQANNAQGSYSSQLSTVPSTTGVQGPTLSIVGAGLTLAQNAAYAPQTLTANTTGFLIGSYTLSANSSEPINVTGLTVGISGSLPITSVSNLYTSVNSTKQNPQSTNNISANFTIPANGSQVVNVYADIGSLSSAASYAGGITVGSSGSVTVTIDGQTVGNYGTTAALAATALITSINANSVLSAAGITAVASSTSAAISISAPTTFAMSAGTNTTVSGLADGSLTYQPAGVNATLTTTLSVTANGATSNAVASAGPVTGQQMTIGSGTLNAPTLTSDTPVSQLVIGGTTGSGIMNLGFTSLIGAATITELDFTSTSSAITSITVGGQTAAFAGVGATTTVSGLNISIPVQNAQVEVPVTVAYAAVGNNGIASNATTTLILTHVKYTSGNASKDIYPVVSSNAVYPVAGYPNIAIVSGSTNSLIAGTNQIAQVTVQAVGNTVNLRQLPLAISHVVTASTSALTVEVNGTNTTIATSTFAGVGNATLTFTNGGYQIQAGQTVTFDVFATVGSITNSGNGDSLTTQLGSASSVLWDDVNGGATGLNANFIPNYSTTNSYTLSN